MQQQPIQGRLHNKGVNPPDIPCIYKPCRQLSNDLAQLLESGELVAFGSWCYMPEPSFAHLPTPNPLTIAHILAGEAGPVIRMLMDPNADERSKTTFTAMHQRDLDRQCCIVVRFPLGDRELVLVPVKLKTGKAAFDPVYWGYVLPAHLLTLTAKVVHLSKLIVVYDIDETLLMAHTVDSLQQRIRRLKATRDAKAAELRAAEAAGPLAMAQQLREEYTALKAEQDMLVEDFNMLQYFRQDMNCCVNVQGQLLQPSWERVSLSTDVDVTRPVVRFLDGKGRPVILTRVFPERGSTSLLIRPRPGWDVLRDYMSGMEDLRVSGVIKQRWEVYVCTTAEQEYAWEAWRLLDPTGSIFPLKELSWRLLCVAHPQKKDLLNVLRHRDIKQLRAAGVADSLHYITDEERAVQPPIGPVPMCVVVDDRLDVWEEESRKAVLQVVPFHPHKEAVAMELGVGAAPQQQYQQALESENELVRVMAMLKDIRSKTYELLDKTIKPEVQRMINIGSVEQFQETAFLITEHLLPLTPIQQLLEDSPFPPPTALISADKDERASDMRLLANDSTMATSSKQLQLTQSQLQPPPPPQQQQQLKQLQSQPRLPPQQQLQLQLKQSQSQPLPPPQQQKQLTQLQSQSQPPPAPAVNGADNGPSDPRKRKAADFAAAGSSGAATAAVPPPEAAAAAAPLPPAPDAAHASSLEPVAALQQHDSVAWEQEQQQQLEQQSSKKRQKKKAGWASGIQGLLQTLQASNSLQQPEEQQQQHLQPQQHQQQQQQQGLQALQGSNSLQQEEQQQRQHQEEAEVPGNVARKQQPPFIVQTQQDVVQQQQHVDQQPEPASAFDLAAAAATATASATGLQQRNGASTRQQQQQQQQGTQHRAAARPLSRSRSASAQLLPEQVVSVLTAAADPAASAADTARYEQLFPVPLQQAAGSAHFLLQMLSALTAIWRLGVAPSSPAGVAIISQMSPQERQVMFQVLHLIQNDPAIMAFFSSMAPAIPSMMRRAGAAAQVAAGGELLNVSSSGAYLANNMLGLQQQMQVQQQQQPQAEQQVQQQGTGAALDESDAAQIRDAAAVAAALRGRANGRQAVDLGPDPAAHAPAGPPQRRRQQQQQQNRDQPGAAAGPQQQQQQQDPGLPQGLHRLVSQLPKPTSAQLQQYGHRANAYDYSYQAMRAASMDVNLPKLFEQYEIRSATQVLHPLQHEPGKFHFKKLSPDQDEVPEAFLPQAQEGYHVTATIHWGKAWGLGCSRNAAQSRRLAAEDALRNMYVSGISFSLLPPYHGPRPEVQQAAPQAEQGAAPAARAAAAAAAAAAAGADAWNGPGKAQQHEWEQEQHRMQQVQQPEQQQHQQQPQPQEPQARQPKQQRAQDHHHHHRGSSSALTRTVAGPRPPQPPPRQQQQQQNRQQQQQQQADGAQRLEDGQQQQQPQQQQQQAGGEPVTCHSQLTLMYGKRVKYIYVGMAGRKLVMRATLHEALDCSSPIIAMAEGFGDLAHSALEAAASNLLEQLANDVPQQQRQQEVPAEQEVAAGPAEGGQQQPGQQQPSDDDDDGLASLAEIWT